MTESDVTLCVSCWHNGHLVPTYVFSPRKFAFWVGVPACLLAIVGYATVGIVPAVALGTWVASVTEALRFREVSLRGQLVTSALTTGLAVLAAAFTGADVAWTAGLTGFLSFNGFFLAGKLAGAE